jgi:hypothetical protein
MDDDAVLAEIRARFPAGILLLSEVKRPETDPAWFAATQVAAAPGTLVVRLVPRGPDAHNPHATDLPGRGHVPEDVYHAVVHGFWRDHDTALRRLMGEVLAPAAARVRLGVWYEGYSKTWDVGRTQPAVPLILPIPSPVSLPSAALTPTRRSGDQAGRDGVAWPMGLTAAGAAVAAFVQLRWRRMNRARRQRA